jgi:membrane-bound lytic murein transglycosylase F
MNRLPRTLLGLLLLGFPGGAATADDAAEDARDLQNWSRKYDHHFAKYSKRYFGPRFDWTWFKAQAIAESRLIPSARSASGARGLMQIMPATFGEIRRANPEMASVNEAHWNIAAGIWYDRYLYERWERFVADERLYFTFASYNAGLGGIRNVLRKTGRVRSWDAAAPHAPEQTRHYVRRIQHLKQREIALQAEPRPRGMLKPLAQAATAPKG